MKIRTLKTCLLLMIISGMVSCSKKSTPLPTRANKKISYQFKVFNTVAQLNLSSSRANITAITSATSAGSISWQSGFANVLSITLDGKNVNNTNANDTTNTNNSFIEPAVYKVDLFSANQLLGNVNIAEGTYVNVDINVDIQSTPSEAALNLKGMYNSANGSAPIELSLNEGDDPLEIAVTSKDLVVGTNHNYIAYINMHLDKLMAGVSTADLDAATIVNGEILIDHNNNSSLYSRILDNINNFSDGDYTEN